jgi:hypothetical protein
MTRRGERIMQNTPFRLLDSPQAVALLRQSLAQVGLFEAVASDGYEAANPYHPACLGFVCRWLPDPVELNWHYYWWPDGTNSELGRVRIVYQGTTRGEVNVEKLLRQRLDRPLAEVIIEGVVALCTELTGKRRDHAT